MSQWQDKDDDELDIIEDEVDSSDGTARRQRCWRILLVDDEIDVHKATEFSLANETVLNRPLEFLHAYSAAEAKEVLARESDIAVLLLDVVMEKEDAGLTLVKEIREDLGLTMLRIVLRTGQPGYAPELSAIRDYDINDYKTKSELTHTKMLTTLTAALRSYEQLQALNTSRRGLDMIVRASGELMGMRGMESFTAGVITQIAGLLGVPPEGVICAEADTLAPGEDELPPPGIIAAAGKYENLIHLELSAVDDPHIRGSLERCLKERSSQFDDQATTIYFHGRAATDMAAYIATPDPLNDIDRQLLEVFCSNIVIGLDNVNLFTRLHSYAFYDQLSNLPNRASFINLMDTELAFGSGRGLVLALIDVDHFAELNDTFGHRSGDKLLQAIASRLKENLDLGIILARVAGDTFGVLGNESTVNPEYLQSLFDTPFALGEERIKLSATLGFARVREIDGGASDALKDANLALKRAKGRQRGHFCYYTRDMAVETRERVQMLQALRLAFEKRQLFLAYQPQVNLEDARTVGLEALLRWRTEDGKYISPASFIPLAESSGLIIELGAWVLHTACEELARLERAGVHGLRMSVNVAISQFRHPQFIDTLRLALEQTGVAPQQIELEVTESMAMEEVEFVVEAIDQIKRTGVTIAIDDFGTGFSSLSYLQMLNIDRLKIDRAFVNQMSGAQGGKIADMVIQLGKSLNLMVIAEGIEEIEQANQLRGMGCHEAQGFYYARPMPAADLLPWLNRGK